MVALSFDLGSTRLHQERAWIQRPTPRANTGIVPGVLFGWHSLTVPLTLDYSYTSAASMWKADNELIHNCRWRYNGLVQIYLFAH